MKSYPQFRYTAVLCLVVGLLASAAASIAAERPATPTPVRGHSQDEPLSGQTLRGTPVTPRTVESFPAEPRNIFWQMDAVASGPNGALEPLNFDRDGDGKISPRRAQGHSGPEHLAALGRG